MFPSHQTEADKAMEDLDKLAFIEYLKREKICETLAKEEETPPARSAPAPANDTHWGRAKSVVELVIGHIMRYKYHPTRVESSKLTSEDKRFYPNKKNIIAVCKEGKTCFVPTWSPVELSVQKLFVFNRCGSKQSSRESADVGFTLPRKQINCGSLDMNVFPEI